MRVEECMSRQPVFADADEPVRAAAEKMLRHDVGALPVQSLGQWIGMVTDRDLALRVIALGLDPEATTVREVMTPGLVSCFAAQPVTDAIELMLRNCIRRVAVLGPDLDLVGILSVDDLATSTPHGALAARVLARVAPLEGF